MGGCSNFVGRNLGRIRREGEKRGEGEERETGCWFCRRPRRLAVLVVSPSSPQLRRLAVLAVAPPLPLPRRHTSAPASAPSLLAPSPPPPSLPPLLLLLPPLEMLRTQEEEARIVKSLTKVKGYIPQYAVILSIISL
ncbi:hypothetical protein TEA_026526 [Camellia sinensis var. sinensis]|uniref:Uncharacterized protein n=1 Tax=Camellia sinensis var. sinensis TaxID=542762 RepID=A0A4S4E4J6_CAMSN|nr:hypothetical protein TEA_026526 [Camellia sinensis var. sinensis]